MIWLLSAQEVSILQGSLHLALQLNLPADYDVTVESE